MIELVEQTDVLNGTMNVQGLREMCSQQGSTGFILLVGPCGGSGAKFWNRFDPQSFPFPPYESPVEIHHLKEGDWRVTPYVSRNMQNRQLISMLAHVNMDEQDGAFSIVRAGREFVILRGRSGQAVRYYWRRNSKGPVADWRFIEWPARPITGDQHVGGT